MFDFFNKKEEEILDSVDILGDNLDFPKQFEINSSELGKFKFDLELKIPYYDYINQLDTIKHILSSWIATEKIASNEGHVDFSEKVRKINISSAPNQVDIIDVSLNENPKLFIRLLESVNSIELMVQAEVIEYLRARYVWHLVGVYRLNNELFTLTDICYLVQRHPWVWILPVFRVAGISS